MSIAKTTLNSKFVGAESDIFSKMVVDAMRSVKINGPDGKAKYPVSQVNLIKSHGQSSCLIEGQSSWTAIEQRPEGCGQQAAAKRQVALL